MTGLQNHDDELVARVRNNIRMEGRQAWSLLAVMAIVSAIFFSVLEFHVPLESAGIAALAVLLVWIAAVFVIQRKTWPRAGYRDEDVLRKTIDDQHRSWRWRYAFIFVVVAILAATITSAFSIYAAHRLLLKGGPGSAALSFNLAWFAVLAAFQICFGPDFGYRARSTFRVLNDELTRTMQRSAAMFGYLLAVIVMCLVLGVTAFRPQWGLLAMPGAIAAVVILPGLYFLVLQWRAERDD